MYRTEYEYNSYLQEQKVFEKSLADEKYVQIKENIQKLRVKKLLYKNYVGEEAAQLYYAKVYLLDPRIKAWYCFYSEETVKKAIKSFFENDYFIKRVAKKCALLDEGDIISEEMDCESYIGKVYDSEGRGHNTSLVQIKLEVLPWSDQGLPFKIVKIRPILDE